MPKTPLPAQFARSVDADDAKNSSQNAILGFNSGFDSGELPNLGNAPPLLI